MTSPVGIPTSRISNMFVTMRLTQQVTSDIIDLYKVEQQLASGQRISLGSEDPGAASRISSYQQLISRNNQVKTNLKAASSCLSQTDSALSTVSNLLISIRANAVGVTGDTATDAQRLAASQQVESAISEIAQIANQKYNGKYLFSGTSTSSSPYTVLTSGYVQYNGNEAHSATFGDLGGLLVATNVTGAETFGGFSTAVQGQSTLVPTLSEHTLLADLNGGAGVSLGAIRIDAATTSHGTFRSTVDLSHAETIGDVVRLIQNNADLKGSINVEIGDHGIDLTLASDTGRIFVSEVGSGRTAASLGILAPNGSAAITGSDLDPVLTTTTPLADLLGTKSQTIARFDGTDNNIMFKAEANGTTLDGATVTFVDDTTAGSESATYTTDVSGNVSAITVHVKAGASTAAQAITAINRDLASAGVVAAMDPADNLNEGQGVVTALAAQAFSGGSGKSIDLTSGLQIVNNGNTYDVSFTGATTVQDVLNTLSSSPAGVVASINAAGDGINVRSNIAGCDFSIGEKGGTTATDLGIRSFDTTTRLSELNNGLGVNKVTGTDFTITTVNGTVLQINVDSCQTVGDVIGAINTAATNAGISLTFNAALAVNGNGIELTDTDTSTTNGITVTNADSCTSATDLGFVLRGQKSATSEPGAVPAVLTGRDVNPSSAMGVFDSLVRLKDALESNDTTAIGDALALLDTAMSHVTFVHTQVGSEETTITTLLDQQSTQDTQLQSSRSNDLDTDYVQAASDLSAKQLAYQAALMTSGKLLKMTLLDYI